MEAHGPRARRPERQLVPAVRHRRRRQRGTRRPRSSARAADSVQLRVPRGLHRRLGRAGARSARCEDAELVFVGYGIVAPEYGWDDFKGVDVKGKVLVVMNNDPEDDPALFAGKTRLYYGRWTYKYEQAARTGAAGAIIIHTTPSAGYRWQVVQTSWERRAVRAAAGASRARCRSRAGSPRTRREARDARRPGPRRAAHGRAERRTSSRCRSACTWSFALKNEVAASRPRTCSAACRAATRSCRRRRSSTRAHHDHLGVQRGRQDRRRRDLQRRLDNASGVAAMLAIAEAHDARCRAPKRSILFAAVAAEEQGLLGASTSPRTRRCRPAASPPTSTSTASTSGAARRTSR